MNNNMREVYVSGSLTAYENLTTGEFIIKDDCNNVHGYAETRGRIVNLVQEIRRRMRNAGNFESVMPSYR